jgi:hypothetical protein
MNARTPTIARIWRGRTARAKADEYAKYLYETGIKPLEQKALAVQQLREDRDSETEFITISYWENVEAMSRFTGADPRQIHHLPRDKEFLIELPKSVQVLAITSSHGLFADDTSGDNQREARLRDLAGKLEFKVVKDGERYSLTRTADVSRPVEEQNLSLAEAEQLLETWKLRGLQGG